MTLELCSEFYALAAIERAAGAFSHLARVTLEAGAERHRVHLEPLGTEDVASLRLEFANWVLADGAARRETPE
jgi:hypothetical protein